MANATYQWSVRDWVENCAGVALLCGGVPGNLLAAAAVALSPELRRHTSSVHIVSLALLDTAVLTFHVLSELLFDLDARHVRTHAACGVHVFAFFLLPDLEAWVLVHMAFERLLAVCSPFRVRTCLTRRRVLVALGVTAALMAAMYTPLGCAAELCTTNLSIPRCCLPHHWSRRTSVLHLLLGFVVPFVLLLAFSAALVLSLLNWKRKSSLPGACSHVHVSSMTAMLVAVNFVFLLCTAPRKLVMLLNVWGLFPDDLWEQLAPFFVTLWRLQYAVNFYIYFWRNPKFRAAFWRLLRGRCPPCPTMK